MQLDRAVADAHVGPAHRLVARALELLGEADHRGDPVQQLEVAAAELQAALEDESPYVRVVAAQALGQYGTADDVSRALRVLVRLGDWSQQDVFVVMASLNALDALGTKTAPVADAIRALPAKGKVPDPRYAPYVPRLLEDLRAGLK